MITLAQKSRILDELLRLNPSLPYEGGDNLWIDELNERCNIKVHSLEDLDISEASKIITKLTNQEIICSVQNARVQ